MEIFDVIILRPAIHTASAPHVGRANAQNHMAKKNFQLVNFQIPHSFGFFQCLNVKKNQNNF